MNRKLLYLLVFIIELVLLFQVPNNRRTYIPSEYEFANLQSGKYSITAGEYFVGDTIRLLDNRSIEFHNNTFVYYIKAYRGDDLFYSVQEQNHSTTQSEERQHELMVLGYFADAVLTKRSPILLVLTFILLGLGCLLCGFPDIKSQIFKRNKKEGNRTSKKYPLELRILGIVMLILSISVECYYLFY